MTLALLFPGVGLGGSPIVGVLTVDTLHTDGTRMEATSEYNVHSTQVWTGLRVMAPTTPALYQTHRFLYVLPVKPDDNDDFGDGFDELVAANFHNLYNCTLIAPEFEFEPWIADHPTDGDYRYESYVTIALRNWVIEELEVSGTEQHWLISFSKGGQSVLTLLLRNPSLFSFAALWDAPISKASVEADVLAGPGWAATAFGTETNYDNEYDVDTHLAGWVASGFGVPRIWLSGDHASTNTSLTYREDVEDLHDDLVGLGVPHYFEQDFQLGAINNGAGYGATTTTVTVDGFIGAVITNRFIAFDDQATVYVITGHAETGGNTTSITFSPGLTDAVADNAPVYYTVRKHAWDGGFAEDSDHQRWMPRAIEGLYRSYRSATLSVNEIKPDTDAGLNSHAINVDCLFRILFNEGTGTDVADTAGSVGPATLISGMTWDTDPFTSEAVLEQPNTDGLVLETSYAGFDGASISLAAWMRLDDLATFNGIVDNENNDGRSFFSDNAGKLQFYPSDGHNTADTGPVGLPAGAWRMVGVTWNPGTKDATFFIEGIENSTVNIAAANPQNSNGNLLIGAIRNNSTFEFQGAWKQVIAWDRILDDAEFAALALNPYLGVQAPGSGGGGAALQGGMMVLSGGLG